MNPTDPGTGGGQREPITQSGPWLQEYLFHQADDGIVIHHAMVEANDSGFLQVNPAICRLLGYSAEEMASLTPRDILAPEDRNGYPPDMQLLQRDGVLRHERMLLTRDGRRVPAQFVTRQVHDADGQRIMSIIRDITESRQAAETLARERQLFQRIVDVIPVLLVIWDPALDRFTLNRHCEQVLGWTSDDANDGDFMAKVYPDPDYRAQVAQYMQSLEPGWRQWLTTASDGRQIPIDWANVRLNDDTMVGIGVDLQQRREIEQALRNSEERLRLIVENSRDGIHQLDLRTNRYTFMSPAQEQLTGFTLDQLEGLGLDESMQRVHPDDRPAVQAYLDRVIAGEQPDQPMEYRWQVKDGAYRWFSDSRKLIRDEQGNPASLVGVSRDITRHKQTEDELRELNESLEQRVASRTARIRRQADQLRALASQLSRVEQRERKRLARLLHDHIQQLIVGARMQLERLRRDAEPDRRGSAVQTIDEILHEALQAARNLAVDLSPPVLHEAGLTGGLNWLAARMQEKHQLNVSLQTDDKAEPESEATRFLLFEATRELLFNIVKHAKVHEADVTLRQSKRGDTVLTVTDGGDGFDPDVLEDRDPEDATFGLFSIRERLAHIGGSMHIESAPGEGTKVSLRAPTLENQEKPHTPATAKEQETGMIRTSAKHEVCQVLIVDDHKIMREGLTGLLEFEDDMEVVGEAASGEEAIELAADLLPDVIVMDVNLGAVSGIEATRRILAEHPHIKVVGLSMHMDKDIAIAMREAGATAYLTKGGPAEDLIATIRASHNT